MSIGPTGVGISAAMEAIVSRPPNPGLVNRIIIRYVNQTISNRPAGVDFHAAHSGFMNMVRHSPQEELYAASPNDPQITPADRLAVMHRLGQISQIFNNMRSNRVLYEAGRSNVVNINFADTAQGQGLDQQFRLLFERLSGVVGHDGALEISTHAGRQVHSINQ